MDLKFIFSGECTPLILLRAIASAICFLDFNVTFTTKRIRNFLSLTKVLILAHQKLSYELAQF